MNVCQKLFVKATTVFVLLTGLVANAGAWELQWYGQAAFRISTPGGKTILIDPYIAKNPKTPEAFKDLKKLGKVDLILVTHGHGDHVGDTPAIAAMTGAKVALNADLGHTLGTLGLHNHQIGYPEGSYGFILRINNTVAGFQGDMRTLDYVSLAI